MRIVPQSYVPRSYREAILQQNFLCTWTWQGMFERCFTQKIEAALDFAEAGLVLSDRTLGTPEITVHNVELFLGVALFFWGEKSRALQPLRPEVLRE